MAIRPLELDDVEQVASLYEHVARSGSRKPPPGLADYFVRMFLEPPNADPEIPSLVYEDAHGKVVGFIGSSVRPMMFDGTSIRVGVSGQLVTEPEVRKQAVGAFLMRDYNMLGKQDLTITDTASETVRRIWEGIGGETSQLASMGWVRIFRPLSFVSDYFVYRDRARALASGARRVFVPVDGLITRMRPASVSRVAAEVRLEPMTPELLAEALSSLGDNIRLRPDYDDDFAGWLLGEVAAVRTRGELVARIVRRDGVVCGSYAYYAPRRGIAQVLHIAGRERDLGDVLDVLFQDAWERGASGVQGRVEAQLRHPLSERRSLFHASGYLALIHARDPEILHAIQAGNSLMTRLDGEWWMGHHLEPFTTPVAEQPALR